jgi:hypothetical protein
MADALYEHFSAILGFHFERSCRFDLHTIGIPVSDLSVLELFFTEQEVREVVMELPNERCPALMDSPAYFTSCPGKSLKRTS